MADDFKPVPVGTVRIDGTSRDAFYMRIGRDSRRGTKSLWFAGPEEAPMAEALLRHLPRPVALDLLERVKADLLAPPKKASARPKTKRVQNKQPAAAATADGAGSD